MLAPGDLEFAGNAASYRADFGSPALSALSAALGRLAAASDGVADAVTRHDRLALTRCNEQAEALVDGGADILLAETVFDTLNLKACLFAIEELFTKRQIKLPVMVSVTITDLSGRTLSG